jgi:bifunctional non-homologous end joining protein LigD
VVPIWAIVETLVKAASAAAARLFMSHLSEAGTTPTSHPGNWGSQRMALAKLRARAHTVLEATHGKTNRAKLLSGSSSRYNAKRDFKVTSEPAGVPVKRARKSKACCFVIQKHWARRLHYDFRLELDGVMLSWAVPKGPSYDPAFKQMAIRRGPPHQLQHLRGNDPEGSVRRRYGHSGTVGEPGV